MRKRIFFITITIVFIIFGIIYIGVKHDKKSMQTETNIKACPDAWIADNTASNNETKQYLIFGSQKKELKDYDVTWIKQHCDLQIRYVTPGT